MASTQGGNENILEQQQGSVVQENKVHEELVHHTRFDDIKETLEILTAQHRSMMEHIKAQDKNVIELQKTLTTMASHNAGIGEKMPLVTSITRRNSDIGSRCEEV
ncbi:hypothetical protein HAX54_046255 [Datura stramonium]|uniref:Uncharacterized protein n=1 Tax=Datura stramonium TaxID=4076 RepID=A0ABS8SRV9_DATST|nr:hypothetical protein [Datura stramonium]